jgi:hypothetical protein
MADKLTVLITVEGNNQTVSKFVAPEKGKIAFRNDAGAVAEVRFEGGSPVCIGNDPQPIFIIESGKQKEFKVCNNTTGNSYKYTATVENSLPEDPILIIERAPIMWVEMAGPVLGGLAVGLIAGYLIANRRRMRSQ